jgi:hypothetical protein
VLAALGEHEQPLRAKRTAALPLFSFHLVLASLQNRGCIAIESKTAAAFPITIAVF